MGLSAAHADAFYDEVLATREVWSVRDSGGVPAPTNSDDQRAMPFWSRRSRAERVTQSVEAFAGFEPFSIPLDECRDRWLPGLSADRILVGLNWGARATGYDVSPEEAAQALAARNPRS